MKKLLQIGLITLLCGCSVNDMSIKNNLTEEFMTMSNQNPISYTTMTKPLYSYYLPKDVGRISSNPLSSLLMKDGVKFIMNFNPNRIVIHDYYQHSAYNGYDKPKILKNNMNYYEIQGTFKGTDMKYHNYLCSITYLENDEYLLLLDMSYVNFTAVLKRVQMQPIIHSMMTIGKSIQYDSKEVIASYSLKYTSDSIIKDLEEFTEELPQNGQLSDLIEKEENNEK